MSFVQWIIQDEWNFGDGSKITQTMRISLTQFFLLNYIPKNLGFVLEYDEEDWWVLFFLKAQFDDELLTAFFQQNNQKNTGQSFTHYNKFPPER